MEVQKIIVECLFAAVLLLSALRLVHPASVALAAALALAVWLGPSVFAGVLPDALLTSAGVMVLGGFMKRSGLAAWLALKAARSARGRPRGLLVRVGLLAFFAGALFGPSAVVLVLPVALLLAVELDVPSLPFVVTLSWCSLIGGTLVLTAQPGNLWVGATLGLDGGTWLVHMLPLTAAALAATLIVALLVFRTSLRVTNERRARVLEYDEAKALEDKPLMVKTLIVLAAVVITLVLQSAIHISPAVIVVAGALLLVLLTSPSHIGSALAEIDGAALLWYGSVMALAAAAAPTVSAVLENWHVDPFSGLVVAAVAGSAIDPGAVAGTVTSVLQGHGWPLIVVGAAFGGGATLWSARSATLSAAVTAARGPGWTRVVLWGLLLAAVNLVVVGAVWLVLG